jgi:hypothetical protein
MEACRGLVTGAGPRPAPVTPPPSHRPCHTCLGRGAPNRLGRPGLAGPAGRIRLAFRADLARHLVTAL